MLIWIAFPNDNAIFIQHVVVMAGRRSEREHMKKGAYGLTYQEVYLMENLTIEAKAIYGMLCSYAGTGDEAYPSVKFICDKLHISKDRFYKHMNLLVGAGIVEKKKTKSEKGTFSSNIYRLVPNSQKTENPYTENQDTENQDTRNRDTDFQDTIINSYNNNNYNNNIVTKDICPELQKTPQDSSGIKLPLIDKTEYDVPLAKIKNWSAAYPAVDIHQELMKMIVWLEANPNRKKTRRGVERFICTWLEKEQNKGGRYRNGIRDTQQQGNKNLKMKGEFIGDF